jgi:hypothetical protein
MINRKPTLAQMEKLWDLVVKYVEDNGVSCAEHIVQSDMAQLNAIHLAEDASEIVGYFSSPE